AEWETSSTYPTAANTPTMSPVTTAPPPNSMIRAGPARLRRRRRCLACRDMCGDLRDYRASSCSPTCGRATTGRPLTACALALRIGSRDMNPDAAETADALPGAMGASMRAAIVQASGEPPEIGRASWREGVRVP